MSQELERLKTLCVAQEAEIARLQSDLDELQAKLSESSLETLRDCDISPNTIIIDK